MVAVDSAQPAYQVFSSSSMADGDREAADYESMVRDDAGRIDTHLIQRAANVHHDEIEMTIAPARRKMRRR